MGGGCLFNLVDIVWGCLIDVIVYPVLKEEVCVCAPAYERSFCHVVMMVVVQRHFNIVALAHIAFVFIVESVGIVFHMPCDEELSSLTCHNDSHTALVAFCNDAKLGVFLDIFSAHFCVTTVWHSEHIVEAAEDGQMVGGGAMVFEDSEHLL